ncbi:hypothetical protein ATANTOWER_021508 [Ataeniobius toweri]|uniref:Uncharacterized protein n=1 Tax=Ataeniobius toweri TaxID=208326 RepID=A0ABU7CIX5_9TELE|nr:hypothetical protein [Ataeniobius toweri]
MAGLRRSSKYSFHRPIMFPVEVSSLPLHVNSVGEALLPPTEAHVYACLKCVKPFSEVASLQEKVKTQLCSCMIANAHSFHSHIFVGMQTDDKLWRSLDFEHHVF